jgi:cob(I)alamin adenosyltransferase
MSRGIIQVYSGEGKGKTTAAVGQAVRAKSAGLNVLFVFFNKTRPEKCGEYKLLEEIGIEVKFFARKHPSFYPETTVEEMKQQTSEGIVYICRALDEKRFDLIVLDEILISVRDSFISEETLLAMLVKKPENIDIILTGRGVTDNICDKADLVSIIENVKHPYKEGLKWREGIEK